MKKIDIDFIAPSQEELAKGIPEQVLENQKPNEEMILHLKRHPMTMYLTGLTLVGGALAVVGAYTIFAISLPATIVLILYLTVGGYHGFMAWYRWWASHYILTTERVISVDQYGIFHRRVREAPLDKLQNVSFEVKGPYQTFLDYGTVRILTAGQSQADVEFLFVPHPYDVQQEMTDAAYRFGNKVLGV